MSRWPNKYVIGLTGNIGVGKSVVRQMLQHLGAYTIDADGLAHRAMSPGAPAYKPVVQTFGNFILDSENRINRTMLASIVFSSPDALAKLEAITHPIVGGAINTLISRAKQQVVVIEAIKLLEGQFKAEVDAVWVVDAKPETQLKRLIDKRQLSEADAQMRIKAQNPQADKLKQASVVIDNDGNVEKTWQQVQIGWTEIQKALTPPKPVAPAPPAAPPQQQPAPVAEAPPTAAGDVVVRRGMPNNAEEIAGVITKSTGNEVTRMDVMLAFGQKSYLLAQDSNNRVFSVMGWQVENLITRVDEFYLEPNAPRGPVISGLVDAVEETSKELQSEVAFIFLPGDSEDEIIQHFVSKDYELTAVNEIKIPAWREAVQEVITDDTTKILKKQLRKERVLKPI